MKVLRLSQKTSHREVDKRYGTVTQASHQTVEHVIVSKHFVNGKLAERVCELSLKFPKIQHWVDKNCLPWAQEYFNNNVKDLSFEDDEFSFIISDIPSVTGHCDVTQRKGKVLCIYDMRLVFNVSGKIKSKDEQKSGTITIAEFEHDQDESEYVYEVVVDNVSSKVRKHLVPLISSKLIKFQPDLIEAHAKDVQHNT
ncbi:hypothetical protein KGF57_000959 [Candida theae]|uniref:Activator of Hsp90 ATPase AHSA1-like N-terminal domain-containing protein n=1 Tax=Candida theae TaxID=1198502 RepID=A0AAD5BI01_9ASCO|nr:uncharacterized protein KGF57_000959 [Candida theae]KAI5964467.1 hypothetical protein KGF57_000959 [Candida theae]